MAGAAPAGSPAAMGRPTGTAGAAPPVGSRAAVGRPPGTAGAAPAGSRVTRIHSI